MGMARPFNVGNYVPGPIMHDYLFKASEISSRFLTFFMSDLTDNSYCEIGGYTTTIFKQGSSIEWFPIEDHFFWMLNIEGFRIGTSDTFADGSTAAWASPNTTRGIMDTGTSFMYIPPTAYTKFVASLMKGLDYLDTDGYLLGPCDPSVYKSIFFFVDGRYIEITPQSFVLNIKYENYCFLALTQNGDDYWLMGDSFLRNYISMWDEDNKRMGFVPHTTSAATIAPGTLATEVILADPNRQAAADFINNYSFNYLQIGFIGGLWAGITLLTTFATAQVFIGYSFVPPLLFQLGLISESTAASWDDFFLWL